MSLTIDANVFVAASRKMELNWRASRDFLARVEVLASPTYCPILILPECAGAIARATGRVRLAQALVAKIMGFPLLELVPISVALGQRSAEVAATYQLRGPDAVYVAVAEEAGTTVVTWDQEMLQRAAGIVPVQTPAPWLQAHMGPLGAGPT